MGMPCPVGSNNSENTLNVLTKTIYLDKLYRLKLLIDRVPEMYFLYMQGVNLT